MKFKLTSLIIVALLIGLVAAGCAKKTSDGGNSAATSVVTSVSESANDSEGTVVIVNDNLIFMNNGEIRVDTKLSADHSLEGFTLKINGEKVTYGTAKVYSGDIEFTLEGTISFPLTAKIVVSNGKNSNMTGSKTISDSDSIATLQEVLARYASTLNKSNTKMYVLLTDDKNASWNSAL